MVASGASTIKEGVGALSDHLVSDSSAKRVHLTEDDESTQSGAWSSPGGEDWPGTEGRGLAVRGKIACQVLESVDDDEIGGDLLTLSEFKLDRGRGVAVEEEEGRARELPRPTAFSPKKAERILESSDPSESVIEEGGGEPKVLEHLAPAEPEVGPEPESSSREERSKLLDQKDWKIVEFDSGSEGEGALSHRSVYGDDSSRSSSAHSGSVGRRNRHSSSSRSRRSARSRSSEVVCRAGSGSASGGKSQSEEKELADFRERPELGSASGSRSGKSSRSTSGRGVSTDSGSEND